MKMEMETISETGTVTNPERDAEWTADGPGDGTSVVADGDHLPWLSGEVSR